MKETIQLGFVWPKSDLQDLRDISKEYDVSISKLAKHSLQRTVAAWKAKKRRQKRIDNLATEK